MVNATKEADPTRSVTCVLSADKHTDLAVCKDLIMLMHFLTDFRGPACMISLVLCSQLIIAVYLCLEGHQVYDLCLLH